MVEVTTWADVASDAVWGLVILGIAWAMAWSRR